ncbi:MAG TPA: WD40 repeat domain-containing protein, partial [Nocardioidaceae bacterium]|nr:WD40 repeat domain-containing protein [Nocardioidaceae bacterium]
RQSLAFDRSTQTEGTLLATLLRSPAVTSTITFPITVRPLYVSVSPDGRTLAIAGNDGQLHLYDTRTRMQTAVASAGGLPAVYMPRSGQIIDTPAGPGNLLRLDGRTGKVLRQYAWGKLWSTTPSSLYEPIETSLDGRFVFVLWAVVKPDGGDGAVYLQRWPVDPPGSGTVRPTVVPLAGLRGMIAARVTPSGHLVVATDGAVTTYDMPSLRRVAQVSVPALVNPVTAAVSPDGRTLGYGKTDGSVHFVDLSSGAAVDGLGAHSADVQSVVFSPDGHLAVTTADDGLVIVWDPSTGAVIERLTGHGGRVITSAFTADGRTLYTSSLDGTVLQWDMSGQRRFGSRFGVGRMASSGAAPVAALSPDGKVLAVRVDDHRVRLFDVAALRPAGSLSIDHPAGVSSLAWAGQQLLVGDSNGSVEEWDPQQARRIAVLPGLTQGVSSIAASPDGHLVAAVDGTRDEHGQDLSGRLVVWRDGRPLRSVRLASPGNAVAFSRDGHLLAVAKDSPNSRDSGPSVLIFDARSGRLLRSMRPETGTISVAFG